MNRVFAVCTLLTVAVACGGSGPDDGDATSEQPEISTSATVAPPATTTEIESVTTNQSATTTATTTSAAPAEGGRGATIFDDPFDAALDSGWYWVAEDPSKWSITDQAGVLRITATAAPSEPAENVLLRPAPSGDFEITTLVRFAPTSDFQFAGLVVYSDPESFLQLGRAYCDVETVCVGDGIYFDSVVGEPTGDNFAFGVRTSADVYLRISAVGDTYTGYYSSDGATWVTIGSHTRSLGSRHVGLIAHQTTVEVVAEFEYFTLESDSTTSTDVTAATEGIRPTPQNVETSIGREVTFCGMADAITQRGDGLQTVFMGALLVYVEPVANLLSRWWEDDMGEDREFCVTGTVQPADDRGSAFITITDGQQIE